MRFSRRELLGYGAGLGVVAAGLAEGRPDRARADDWGDLGDGGEPPAAGGGAVEYLEVPLETVPYPRNITFTVRHGDRDPVTLEGHYWYNRDALRAGRPMPAIVELNPYRRRDGTMLSDARMYPWFALNEYLCFRVDLQGSGDSGGVITDEYTPEELDYCAQVIEQVAGLPICDGNVGMMGKSWSSINSLLTAAAGDMPAALKAIICCAGTDDPYNDDIHYMGGAMMMDNVAWPAAVWGWLASPPDPAIVGSRWRELWRQRIRGMSFWFEQWASHQTRDGYWRATSVRDRYDQVKVPVFVISGWQDGYKNSSERLVRNLAGRGLPASGILGPWGHKYPFSAYPGPRIDWLRYATTNWWDRWLKGKAPDPATEWPELVVWMGESREPPASRRPDYTDQGRWVAEDHAWMQRAQDQVLYLCPRRGLAARRPAGPRILSATATATIGSSMLETSSWGEADTDDLPGDQNPDDRHSLTFESPPLREDLPVFGYPTVRLSVTADRPLGAVQLRLSEVSPRTGRTHLVTYRLFNLAYHQGDAAFTGRLDHPRRLTPGQRFSLTVPLNVTGHVFKAGWRLRLEISPIFFPVLWESVRPPTLQVHVGPLPGAAPSALILPRRRPRPQDARIQRILKPVTAYVDAAQYVPVEETRREARTSRTVKRVLIDGRAGTRVHKVFDNGSYVYGGALHCLLVDQKATASFSVRDGDHLSATGFATSDSTFARGNWKARAVSSSRVWSELTREGAAVFRYEARVQAYVNDRLFESKRVQGTIPRRWI